MRRMMMRSRFTEEQIIGILREQEGGQATVDVCRRQEFSGPTFYSGRPSMTALTCPRRGG